MDQAKDVSKFLPLQGELAPEIYTDNALKTQKYQHVLIFPVILLPALTLFEIQPASEGSSFFDLFSILKTIMGFFMILYVYVMVRIFGRILQLTKK